MSGDGTTDRGAKPPRTLFSLGRPGPKTPAAATDAGLPTADAPVDAPTDAAPDELVELACGACGATLITGAAFCGECGTPVALDDDDFELVEEVPMADLEDVAFGEYVEELPIDDAPAVLYAGTDAAPATEDDAPATDDEDPSSGATVMAQPAAVLYADPSQAEPLPPTPSGTFAISEPTYGTAEGALDINGEAVAATDGTEGTDATEATDGAGTETAEGATEDYDHGAAPLVAGAAVAGAAVIGTEAAADAASEGAEAPLADTAPVGTDATAEVPAAEEAPVEPAASTWSDAPTTVTPAAVPLGGAAVGAAAGAAIPPTPVASATYGGTPPSGDAPKSKTGLLVGVGAAVVVVLIVGAILIVAGGNKEGAVQTAQQTSTTTAAPSSTTTTVVTSSSTTAPTSTSGPTTTAPTSTSEPATTPTTAAPVVTVTPTTAAPTTRVTVTSPPTTALEPGRIVANPAAGTPGLSIPKGGSMTIALTNVGGTQAGCALTGSTGISVSQNCSPSISPGQTITVTVQAAPTWEGPVTITGVLEGSGNYQLSVAVLNR